MTTSAAATGDPIEPFLERQGALVLDGALATELEARGCELDDALWSASVLWRQPERIAELHRDSLEAGADCVISASYQATIEGFVAAGAGAEEARRLLARSVALARDARDAFWADAENRPESRHLRPLVAASVGPYGAYLADGSEYRGDYGLDEEALVAFHRERWEVLCGAGPDLMACETIPSAVEARALAHLLAATPGARAWMSFSCRDEAHLADGTPIAQVAGELESLRSLIAVGVNCVSPEMVAGLIAELRGATNKPIVVYPNSGERWDAAGKRWLAAEAEHDVVELAAGWLEAGARMIGGCCRVRPETIRRIRRRLLG